MSGVKGKMSGLRHLISFDDATSRMKAASWKSIPVIEVEVSSSLDMVVAESILSEVDVPAYDRSAVDGYAVNHLDIGGADSGRPASLKVSGRAGFDSSSVLHRGQCCEIFTGGRIPEGSDSVVMAEYVTVTDGKALFSEPARAWENISRRGEDITTGTRIIDRGDVIKSWHVAAMISIGLQKVKVYRKIRLGVISTGNEIARGSKSGVRNTTQPLMINYFRKGYVETSNEGIFPDDPGEIGSAVDRSLESVDVLVVTGGSSIGKHDLSVSVLSEKGNRLFRGVMMKPGRTISLFEISGKPVFSVSGLPVAALTSFEAFFDRFMIDVLGFNDSRQIIRARLTEKLINNGGMRSFVRIVLSRTLDSLEATPLRNTGSGLISSLTSSNGVTVVPESVEGVEKGEYVWVTLTGGPV